MEEKVETEQAAPTLAPPDVPPQWVLDAIYATHHLCRLGWAGGPQFAVVELWRQREAPETIAGEPFLGHVYGRSYDAVLYVPLHIMDATVAQVFDGTVVDMVKRATSSFKERVIAARRQIGLEIEKDLQEQSAQLGDQFYHEMQRDGAPRAPIVARKFLSEQEKAVIAGDYEAAHDYTDRFIPQPGVGAPIK
jgi:hypothetical protein